MQNPTMMIVHAEPALLQLERETIAQGSNQLIAVARELPKVLEAYYARLAPVSAAAAVYWGDSEREREHLL
jgi:hypothetical protein